MDAGEAGAVGRLVAELNSRGAAVAVEGRRDAAALRAVGYTGDILEFHGSGGPAAFADAAAGRAEIVMLFDSDRKGREIARRAGALLERRTRLDRAFRGRLYRATRGRVRCTEQLACYGALGPDAPVLKGL